MKKKLRSKKRRVRELSDDDVRRLWEIFDETYEGVEEENFRRDLAEKDRVITLHDRDDDRILGFSTLAISRVRSGGRNVWVLFSGDTALMREAWGDRSLMTGFLTELVRFRFMHPFAPFYWLLISKGFKTYLLLSRNFPTYWPRHDRKMPAPERVLMKDVVRDRFSNAIETDDHIFRLPADHGRVRAGLAPLSPELLQYSDIRFFAETNPKHAEGSELCCLGKVDWHLIFASALKVMRSPKRRKHKAKAKALSKTDPGKVMQEGNRA